jgi:hypothetical protein
MATSLGPRRPQAGGRSRAGRRWTRRRPAHHRYPSRIRVRHPQTTTGPDRPRRRCRQRPAPAHRAPALFPNRCVGRRARSRHRSGSQRKPGASAAFNAFREEPIGQLDTVREIVRWCSRRWPRYENEGKDNYEEHEFAHNQPFWRGRAYRRAVVLQARTAQPARNLWRNNADNFAKPPEASGLATGDRSLTGFPGPGLHIASITTGRT